MRNNLFIPQSGAFQAVQSATTTRNSAKERPGSWIDTAPPYTSGVSLCGTTLTRCISTGVPYGSC
jgi:hypothetical protein